MVKTVNLHLLIDGTSHDVTRGKAQALIIFLHETLAVRQTENTAVTTHGLCDKECRMSFARMIEGSRVELYKLHVGYCALGTIDHRLTIACGNNRVGSGLIDRTATTGTHHSHLAEISIYFLSIRIEDVGSVAVDVRSATGNACAQVVLGDNLHCEVILLDVDVWVVAYGFHQSSLDFSTRIVGVMEDAELAVSALTVKVELAVLLLVEVDSPFHQFLNLFWCLGNNLFNCFVVTDVVTSNHCILDVLVEVIYLQVGN